jgi:hypothetical protein
MDILQECFCVRIFSSYFGLNDFEDKKNKNCQKLSNETKDEIANKSSNLNLKSEFQEIFTQNFTQCSDNPYCVHAQEILIELTKLTESTKNKQEKQFYALLNGFITVLDYLCHKDSRFLRVNYVKQLDEMRKSTDAKNEFADLIDITTRAFELSLKNVRLGSTSSILVKSLKQEVKNYQDYMNKFMDTKKHLKNFYFINNYCKILSKLPKLALIRRGFFDQS